MKYVRVKNDAGHEFSEPEGSPLIRDGGVRVVDRKAPTTYPLPPKFNPFPHENVPAQPDDKKEG
jgi:hypothetical protein